MPKSWYRIRNAGKSGVATVYIYSDIGMWGISASQFAREFNDIDAETIDLRINSNGGEVFEGLAMHNVIRNHPAHVIAHVDGICASAATLPMLAADEVRIAANAYVMIHNPHVEWASGEAKQLRKQADLLDQLRDTLVNIYVEGTGGDEADIREMVEAETWLTAEQAVAAGFADAVTDESDDVPADPKNQVRRYLNRLSARSRVRPGKFKNANAIRRVLDAYTPSPARAGRNRRMKNRNPKSRSLARRRATAVAAAALAAAAVWPDAADVRAGVLYGPAGDDYEGTLDTDDGAAEEPENNAGDTKPANKAKAAKKGAAPKAAYATPTEIKAAFKNDPAFALERVDVQASLIEHKAAYADHLTTKLANKNADNSRLKNELARQNPASAGVSGPLATAGEGDEGGDGDDADEFGSDRGGLSPLARARAKRAAMSKRK